ncbi:unnamed protein product, partial [Rotaria sp. Silwood1]
MSLPCSPRVTGTDGNEFHHRERIGSPYRISAATKSR